MEDSGMILDYCRNLSRIMVKMRGLGDKIPDSEVVAKLLRLVSGKFNAIASSIEQFQEIDTPTLDKVLGSRKNKDKVKDRSAKREEKTLLARALRKIKKKDDDSS